MSDKQPALRERLARVINDEVAGKTTPDNPKCYLDVVNKVLSDTDIKKGLELLKLYKVGKIVKLADNQKPPDTFSKTYEEAELKRRVQKDMIEQGWVKIDKEWK